MSHATKKRIVVKVGTKVLTDDNGVIAQAALATIADQIFDLKQSGYDVVLVSSGAMGAGKSLLKTTKRLKNVSEKQLYSAIGQAHLIARYSELFGAHNVLCAQVLATKEDFRDTSHFFNMRSCMETLLHDGVVPIVNENDVVALSELAFTDNDELAGLVASMLNADQLIILSSIDGVIDTNSDAQSVIRQITLREIDSITSVITADKSEAGRGGMTTKFAVAKRLARQGIEVIIANGTTPGILADIVGGASVGTRFVPGKKQSSTKRRLTHTQSSARGNVTVNDQAATVLSDAATTASLLLVGVTRIEGEFKKGDLVSVSTQSGHKIGYGLSQYSHAEATSHIGRANIKPLIQYDYLVIEAVDHKT
jgi:glutamate 5-kinase